MRSDDSSPVFSWKSAQGVKVSVIYDSVGSLNTPRSFFDRLTAGGVEVLEFNPINPFAPACSMINHRDHRKLLVVDGQTAFVGGINISGVYSSGSSALCAPETKSPRTYRGRDPSSGAPRSVVADLERIFFGTHGRKQTDAAVRVEQKLSRSEAARGSGLYAIGSDADNAAHGN